MLKVIALIKRKDGLTFDDFSRYWEHKHAPLALENLPWIKKYVQNHALKLSKGEPPFDGAAEIWVEDLQSWREMADFLGTEQGKAIREDEEKFLDRSKVVFLLVEEKVIMG